MQRYITLKLIASSALFYWATGALAHENHGLPGYHWHATDTLGFAVLAGLAAVVAWLLRK